MTKSQIRVLRSLGYESTQEEGAVLQHKVFMWEDRFIWADQSFGFVLDRHNFRLEEGIRRSIAKKIIGG